MKKINFTVVSDSVFTFLCVWLTALCIFRYYSFSLPLSIFLGALFAAAAAVAAYLILYSVRSKKILKKRDEEEKAKLMLHLALSDEEYILNLLSALFKDKFRKTSSSLINGSERIVPLFFMQPVSADKIAETVKKYQRDKITVYCNDMSSEAKKLCSRLHVNAIYSSDVYLSLKSASLLPEKYICEENAKRTLKDKLKEWFSSANCKPFFVCGSGLLVLSLFAVFPVYYLISGSVLVITSLALKLISLQSVE